MKIKVILTVVFFGILTTCLGQQNPSWEKWSWLIGDWAGEGSGQPGVGGGTFTFKTDLDKNILVRNSHSEFEMSQDGEKFSTYIEGKSKKTN